MFLTLNDGTKIYYNINGKDHIEIEENKNYLIFLHGGPGMVDHSFYVPFWSKLANTIDIIFFDMRGHGRSGGHDQPKFWNLKQWGQDVFDFCRAKKIIAPIVAGISFGGWVALSYACQYPNHPKGLILCHTEAKIDMEKKAAAYKRKAEQRGLDSTEIVNVIHQLKTASNDINTHRLFQTKCIPLYSSNPYTEEEFKKCFTNLKILEAFQKEQYSFNFFPDLATLTCPVHIITGEQDPEHPPECAIEMQQAMTASLVKLDIIKGAGAPAYREKEQEVLDLLNASVNKMLSPDNSFSIKSSL